MRISEPVYLCTIGSVLIVQQLISRSINLISSTLKMVDDMNKEKQ